VIIYVEVFAGIMMPTLHLEIQTYRFSESIVTHAIWIWFQDTQDAHVVTIPLGMVTSNGLFL